VMALNAMGAAMPDSIRKE